MSEAGFKHLVFYENGLDALNYLESLIESGKQVVEEVQLVITDIEMPQMDGHHLTRRIKENSELTVLPVIIFSSLITDSLRHKGQVVRADAQISKPEIAALIDLIDKFAIITLENGPRGITSRPVFIIQFLPFNTWNLFLKKRRGMDYERLLDRAPSVRPFLGIGRVRLLFTCLSNVRL